MKWDLVCLAVALFGADAIHLHESKSKSRRVSSAPEEEECAEGDEDCEEDDGEKLRENVSLVHQKQAVPPVAPPMASPVAPPAVPPVAPLTPPAMAPVMPVAPATGVPPLAPGAQHPATIAAMVAPPVAPLAHPGFPHPAHVPMVSVPVHSHTVMPELPPFIDNVAGDMMAGVAASPMPAPPMGYVPQAPLMTVTDPALTMTKGEYYVHTLEEEIGNIDTVLRESEAPIGSPDEFAKLEKDTTPELAHILEGTAKTLSIINKAVVQPKLADYKHDLQARLPEALAHVAAERQQGVAPPTPTAQVVMQSTPPVDAFPVPVAPPVTFPLPPVAASLPPVEPPVAMTEAVAPPAAQPSRPTGAIVLIGATIALVVFALAFYVLRR